MYHNFESTCSKSSPSPMQKKLTHLVYVARGSISALFGGRGAADAGLPPLERTPSRPPPTAAAAERSLLAFNVWPSILRRTFGCKNNGAVRYMYLRFSQLNNLQRDRCICLLSAVHCTFMIPMNSWLKLMAGLRFRSFGFVSV